MNIHTLRAALAAAFVLGTAAVAPAANQTVTLTDIARGWYNESGGHTAAVEGYFVGLLGTQYHNFLVFDLASVPGTIRSATLRLEVPGGSGFTSPDGAEDFELHEVTTDPATLDVDATGQTAIYDDLADGPVFGTRQYTPADIGTITEIELNSAAVTALNAAAGDLFAFGGTLTSIVGANNQYVFGNSFSAPYLVELVIDYGTDDSYKCYKAKDLKFPAPFAGVAPAELVDAYITDPTASVTKLASVCTPVDRDGRGVFDPTTARCCYKVKAAQLPAAATASLDDEFGTLGVSFQKAQTLCVPCTLTPTP